MSYSAESTLERIFVKRENLFRSKFSEIFGQRANRGTKSPMKKMKYLMPNDQNITPPHCRKSVHEIAVCLVLQKYISNEFLDMNINM